MSSDAAPNPPVQVTAAKSTERALLVLVNGFWAGVESQDALLDQPLCILVDTEQSSGYFAHHFAAQWPGDPTNGSAPHLYTGGTESAVVACLLEEYLALNSVEDTDLPVPDAVEAEQRLPALQAARRARGSGA